MDKEKENISKETSIAAYLNRPSPKHQEKTIAYWSQETVAFIRTIYEYKVNTFAIKKTK